MATADANVLAGATNGAGNDQGTKDKVQESDRSEDGDSEEVSAVERTRDEL